MSVNNFSEETNLNSDKIKPIYIPEDAENSGNSHNKKLPALFATRNPLGDLCENTLPGRRIASTRKIHKSNIVVEVKQVKPSGSNDKQTKVKYTKKSENITERRDLEEAVKTSDEVFVEGEDHYLNYLPAANVLDVSIPSSAKSDDIETEISKPLPVIRISCPGELVQVKRPSQKVTLARKLSNRHKRIKDDHFYSDSLYDVDYYRDNYAYMRRIERHFVFRRDLMRKNIREDYRRLIVNWLIYVQQILSFEETTFFIGIRIYDYVLLSLKLPVKQYLLAGITSLWIAGKQADVQYMQVTRLLAICNGKYSKQEMLSMEREILNLVKFNVNFPEPATFLFYYLDEEKLQTDAKIRNSAMFLLEVFTLLLDFSSMAPSLLACIALYLVLVKNNLDSASFLTFIESHILDKDTFTTKSQQFEYFVNRLMCCKAASKEVIEKYSREGKCFVALDFLPK